MSTLEACECISSEHGDIGITGGHHDIHLFFAAVSRAKVESHILAKVCTSFNLGVYDESVFQAEYGVAGIV